MHLSNSGMKVDVAEDAAIGIRLLLESPPDLILLDLDLPYMGGLEVLDALKGDGATADIPVLILTSRNDDDCFTQAKRLGAESFLTKPVKRDHLIAEVQSLLEKGVARKAAGSAQQGPAR